MNVTVKFMSMCVAAVVYNHYNHRNMYVKVAYDNLGNKRRCHVDVNAKP